jgi:hypothetical protein
LSGDPAETGRRYTVVAKTVDDKLAAERRSNKLNHMRINRRVPVAMARVTRFIGKGWLAKQQCKSD